VLFVFHLLGYLWTTEFIKGMGMITMSGAIATDYWVDKKSQFYPSMPIAGAFYRAMRYHLGSAIYGALILAIIRLVRYAMMYIDSKTAELQKKYCWIRVLMKVVQCCLWCLEKCVRYLTNSAYVLVAIEGRGFCTSAWRAFKLLFSNSLRVATTLFISWLIIFIAQVGIVAACVIGCYIALTQMEAYTPDGGSWVRRRPVPLSGFLSSPSSFLRAWLTAGGGARRSTRPSSPACWWGCCRLW
jgi:choline transporter-like protein 2/4/5